MKINIVLLIIFVEVLFAQNISVMSYNIRYDNPGDGENKWEIRKKKLCELINYYSPDILGVQEALKSQLTFIHKKIDGYSYYGIGRDDGKEKGEYAAVFYDNKRFEVVEDSTFWLSQTSNIPSKGWDAACERICTYLLLKYKDSSKKIIVLNTHFDHIGNEARIKSAEMIIKFLKDINKKNYPVYLMGDFNLTEESEPIKLIKMYLNDSRLVSSSKPYGPEGTFNNFKFTEMPKDRIDYVFVSEQISIKKYQVIDDFYNFKYPSDHLPVFIKSEIKKEKNK